MDGQRPPVVLVTGHKGDKVSGTKTFCRPHAHEVLEAVRLFYARQKHTTVHLGYSDSVCTRTESSSRGTHRVWTGLTSTLKRPRSRVHGRCIQKAM